MDFLTPSWVIKKVRLCRKALSRLLGRGLFRICYKDFFAVWFGRWLQFDEGASW